MRVLVTGASGQVGASFSAKAKGYGLNVIEISRQNWDMAKFPQLGEKYIVNHRPDLVLNCAAFTDVNAAEQKKKRRLRSTKSLFTQSQGGAKN